MSRAGYIAVLCGVVAALLLGIFWFGVSPNDERTRLLWYEPRGSVHSGAALGVSVGETWGDADSKIRRLFKPSSVLWQTGAYVTQGGTGVVLSRAPVLAGDATVRYRDDSWRNGVIILEVRDGRVVGISWNYAGPFAIDL